MSSVCEAWEPAAEGTEGRKNRRRAGGGCAREPPLADEGRRGGRKWAGEEAIEYPVCARGGSQRSDTAMRVRSQQRSTTGGSRLCKCKL